MGGLNVTGSTVRVGKISGVYLPADTLRFLGNYGNNAYSTGTPTYMSIGSDGDLYIYPSSTGSGKSIFFNVTYMR